MGFILYTGEWFELAGGAESSFEDEDSSGDAIGHENVLRSYPPTYFYPWAGLLFRPFNRVPIGV